MSDHASDVKNKSRDRTASAKQWRKTVEREANRRIGRPPVPEGSVRSFTEAGYHTPFIKRSDGKWEYLNQKEAIAKGMVDHFTARTKELLEAAGIDVETLRQEQRG